MPTTPARHWIAALLPALVALVLPAGAAGAWLPPVPGPPVRGFDLGPDPFAAGQHRGADLAAPAGTTVRAPCAGEVAVAGRVGTSGGVVTLVCGQWRVSHLPLATITVEAGETTDRGDTLGTVAQSSDHAGLHLGVRGDGDRFAYTDPLPFLGHDRVAPPAIPAPRHPRPTDRSWPPKPRAPRVPAAARLTQPLPAVEPAARAAAAGAERTAAGDGPPWTVVVGLLLAAAAFVRRPRRRGAGRLRPGALGRAPLQAPPARRPVPKP